MQFKRRKRCVTFERAQSYHWREVPQVSFLSHQTRVCRDKQIFVATIDVFCRDKHVFVTTKLFSRQKLYLWQLPPMTVQSSFHLQRDNKTRNRYSVAFSTSWVLPITYLMAFHQLNKHRHTPHTTFTVPRPRAHPKIVFKVNDAKTTHTKTQLNFHTCLPRRLLFSSSLTLIALFVPSLSGKVPKSSVCAIAEW